MSLVAPFEDIFADETGLLARHKSWKRLPLGEVCKILNGYPFKSELFNHEKGFPIIRIRDLSKGATETFYAGEVPPEVVVSNGDLLIGMDGIFRCWEWHGEKAGLNQRVCKIIPDDKRLDRKFLLYALNGYLKAIEQKTSSVTVGHLSSRDVLRIPFPLPLLAEQQRIVGKLEKLLGQVNGCQQRLAKIPALLKRFRQAVLAAACSGRLTADWQDKNPDAEPYAVTTEDGVELDEEFPRNWKVVRLGTLTALVTSGSRGWARYYAESGSIFIRAQNINSDFLNLDDIAFVRPPVSAEGLRTKVKQYDLLITITGANVTKSALVEKPIEDAYVSQHVALVRLKDTRISEFLFHSIVSLAHGRKQLQAAAYGQGKPGLNLDNIRDVVVGLPPLSEQKEIVHRVASLFALADRIEARFSEGRKRVDSITQAILAKAFRGELVPTEFELAKAEGRSFESAAELLERIQKNGQQRGKDRSLP